ncbi:hypothetical protein [Methanolobus sp.]|uniref:hypothetical protein n=1 Tax=Methanolobus sp. TaxID=1874737 RepID=UPI0025FAB7E0|nr:hypothetical protein [Methanolobus sp.]
MLTSTITTTTASAVSSTAAGIVSMTTPIGMNEYAVMAVIALITALIANELLIDSSKWNKSLSYSLTMTIVPLTVSFVAIVIFRISEII